MEKLGADCDFIVCACDGIWDCMSSQEVCTFVGERIKKKGKVGAKNSLSAIIAELYD